MVDRRDRVLEFLLVEDACVQVRFRRVDAPPFDLLQVGRQRLLLASFLVQLLALHKIGVVRLRPGQGRAVEAAAGEEQREGRREQPGG